MTLESGIMWNGVESLSRLTGPSSEVSPLRTLFLVHRIQATGRLWMTRGLSLHAIDFQDGRICGCTGFVELVDGISGERQFSIEDWSSAIAEQDGQGTDPRMRVARALCKSAVKAEEDGDWMVNFVVSDASGEQLDGESLLESMSAAIREHVTVDDIRSWFEQAALTGLHVDLPTDSERAEWGIGDREGRLLDCVERDGSAGALFMEIGSDGWGHLGVLWRLGLVKVSAGSEGTVEVEAPASLPEDDDVSDVAGRPAESTDSGDATADSVEPERRRRERRTEATSRDVPRRPSEERRRKDRRTEDGKPQQRARKKRRIDPRRVALRRAPFESAPELVEQHLKEAYDVLGSVSPEFLFRLRKTDDLQKSSIEQRYHKLVTRYHPDRYRNQTQAVKALAEGCFTAVSDAFHLLQDPAYMSELRIRVIEKETGKKVVTDKTRATAKVDFAKADALFKQKRFDGARDLALRAQEGDPDRWQYAYLALRAGYRSGSVELADVERGILSLQGMTTVEKADQLYTLGEIQLKEGDEEKAYKLFSQAISLDDKNVGANRRLRLRDRRAKEQEKSSGGGLFGGLFRGKR